MSERNTMAPAERERIRKPSAMQRIRRRMSRFETTADAARVLESRCLLAATAVVLVSTLLWVIAISTDYWFIVTPADGATIYQNRTKAFFVSSHSGIWTICKRLLRDGNYEKTCHNHQHFPPSEFIEQNPEVDRTILDYTRTEVAFAIISMCLLLMGLGFSLYTFSEPRYMFKRLAAGVHLLAAASILVVVEVVVNSVHYEEQNLNARHPKGAIWRYGFSFLLACIAMVLVAICGITFLVCSRKRKGDQYNPGDAPNILGRT